MKQILILLALITLLTTGCNSQIDTGNMEETGEQETDNLGEEIEDLENLEDELDSLDDIELDYLDF
jgi:PBP1b-binding outer membrane lipoprotein LpoB